MKNPGKDYGQLECDSQGRTLFLGGENELCVCKVDYSGEVKVDHLFKGNIGL
jgi:hypothetical protein